MTYALIGLPTAILRPIAAFSTAFVSGAAQLIFKTDDETPLMEDEVKKPCCKKNESPDEEKVQTASLKSPFDMLLSIYWMICPAGSPLDFYSVRPSIWPYQIIFLKI